MEEEKKNEGTYQPPVTDEGYESLKGEEEENVPATLDVDSPPGGYTHPANAQGDENSGRDIEFFIAFLLSFFLSVIGFVIAIAFFYFHKALRFSKRARTGSVLGLASSSLLLFGVIATALSFPTYEDMTSSSYGKDTRSRMRTSDAMETLAQLSAVVLIVGVWLHYRVLVTAQATPKRSTLGTQKHIAYAGIFSLFLPPFGLLIHLVYSPAKSVRARIASAAGTAMQTFVIASVVIRACVIENSCSFCMIDHDNSKDCPNSSDYSAAIMASLASSAIFTYVAVIIPSLLSDLAHHREEQ